VLRRFFTPVEVKKVDFVVGGVQIYGVVFAASPFRVGVERLRHRVAVPPQDFDGAGQPLDFIGGGVQQSHGTHHAGVGRAILNDARHKGPARFSKVVGQCHDSFGSSNIPAASSSGAG